MRTSHDRSRPRNDDQNDIVGFAFFEQFDCLRVTDAVQMGVIDGDDDVAAPKPTIERSRRTRHDRLHENGLGE